MSLIIVTTAGSTEKRSLLKVKRQETKEIISVKFLFKSYFY
jgi:hypothetical protein